MARHPNILKPLRPSGRKHREKLAHRAPVREKVAVVKVRVRRRAEVERRGRRRGHEGRAGRAEDGVGVDGGCERLDRARGLLHKGVPDGRVERARAGMGRAGEAEGFPDGTVPGPVGCEGIAWRRK